MNALVSVIVPVYNNEKFLKKCISSLLTQKYTNIEVILINDGSTDKSGEIIEGYLKKNERIKYINQENSGVADARNRGVESASGKYLLFVDSDDYIGVNYVYDLVHEAEKNNSDLVICGYTLVDASFRLIKSVVPQNYIAGKNETWAYRISAVCSRLYKKKFWEKNSIKFIQEAGARGEDVPICLYTNAMAKNVRVIKNTEYYYVQHKESAMNSLCFSFPYRGFELYYRRVTKNEIVNSSIEFYIGVLKFLAQFDIVLYRKAPKSEKKQFIVNIKKILGDDLITIRRVWRRERWRIDYPIVYKIAMDLFCIKCK